jgi:hypothetical protein
MRRLSGINLINAKKEYIYVGTWSKLQGIVIIDIHRTKHDKARKIKTHLWLVETVQAYS